jgi:hypothetical protein
MDVFFRRDIANILASVGAKDRMAEARHAPDNQEYHRGVQDALVAVGLAFGLQPVTRRDRSDGPIWIEGSTND